jgi:sarcosine oxidase subunit beta
VRVTGIRVEAGRVQGVVTDTEGEIATPVVVNATGLWAARVAGMVGARLPVLPGRHPVFSVRRPPSFGAPHAVLLDLARGTYFRPETGDLTVTGTLDSDESQQPVDPDADYSGVEFAEVERTLARSFASMPALGEATFARAYAGAFDITPDWNPILGELPEALGFYCAVGFSGHGFKLCPAVGDLMAQLITAGRADLDLALFSPVRFAASATVHGTFISSYLRPSD